MFHGTSPFYFYRIIIYGNYNFIIRYASKAYQVFYTTLIYLSIYLKKIITKSEKRFSPVIKLWQNAQKSVDLPGAGVSYARRGFSFLRFCAKHFTIARF